VQPPTKVESWSVFLYLYATLPIANGIIIAMSFMINSIVYDVSIKHFTDNICKTVAFNDVPFGIVALSSSITLLSTTAPFLMRRLARHPGWMLLKYFIMWQICGGVTSVVGQVLAKIIMWDE
jgi:hypothetical protein